MTLAANLAALARRVIGTAANNLIALDTGGKLPAVPGGKLTGMLVPSELFTPTLAGLLTWAHGLPAKPVETWAVLVCQVAELGYAVGEESPRVPILLNAPGSTATWNSGVTTWADATNVYGRVGSSYLSLLMSKTSGGIGACTLANWKVKLYARVN